RRARTGRRAWARGRDGTGRRPDRPVAAGPIPERSPAVTTPAPIAPPSPLNPSPRVLLGPGPSDVHPRVLAALGMPLLGHLDPEFVALMDETQALLRHV